MPKHIDPLRLPVRCFWDARDHVWYTIHKDPKPRRQRIASEKATLAELHQIMESIVGIARGSLAYLLDEFHASNKFSKLSPRTQRDYNQQRAICRTLPTRVGKLDTLITSRMSLPMMQVLFDSIAKKTPTKANHLLRYLRRVFSWGMQRGLCKENPCAGAEQATERKLRRQPEPVAVMALVSFFRERGAITIRRAGACAPYLWISMELAYLCRLRGIEVITLTDAHATSVGVHTNRTKGSRDNVTRWSARLRAAWDAAIALRDATWKRCCTPVPMRADQRTIIVGANGLPLRKGSFDSAWQTAITIALAAGVISHAQRFALHDLKRMGITDTPGTRGEKQLASGHKSEQMLDIYDYSVPVVNPAGELG